MSLLAILLGALIGLSLGALGGGGSILTVPALVYALGQSPRTATTSSLLIVGLTALIAVVPHARAGRVRLGQGLVFGALGTAGSFAGSALSSRVPPQVLLTAFAALMLVVATLMLRRSRGSKSSDQTTNTSDPTGALTPTGAPMFTLRPFTCICPRVAKVVATATAVGLMTGFFGVGGGFVLVPALVLALSFPMPVAVGTSLLVIAVNSATALTARVSSGSTHLDRPLITTFTGAAVIGSLLGGQIAGRAHPRHLTRAFALLLVAVAAYTAARSIPALL
ncbi:sulfite exporter TauE/SafE family protein [Lapillicoccus sp.]|uniref:sulfite exporter TauE/SafE family protein n=1 Tax=Lapillicoccus sp. TaxID=1909287 RepID=UPI0025DF054C|nr:sulfite exporter TauE/SafE family protein [Lapillicoccus sp.]